MKYDSSYHKVFSNPEMVKDLLLHFVHEDWVAQLDFSTLQRVNAKFHADQGERREGDVIFKVNTTDGGIAYLYLLLEFQSTPDSWMGLRVQTYVSLLWQHLEKEKQLTPNHKLPPVFPLVLYNGTQRWHTPQDLKSLVDLPKRSSLWVYQPTMRYYLINEQDYPQGKAGSISGALFKLENTRQMRDIDASMQELDQALKPIKSVQLIHDITYWLFHVMDIGRQIPIPLEHIENITEARHMLQERMKEFKQDLLAQGEKKGELKGELKGERKLLIKIAQHRFGTLPQQQLEKIEQATNEQLEQWGIKIIDAKSLDEVFH